MLSAAPPSPFCLFLHHPAVMGRKFAPSYSPGRLCFGLLWDNSFYQSIRWLQAKAIPAFSAGLSGSVNKRQASGKDTHTHRLPDPHGPMTCWHLPPSKVIESLTDSAHTRGRFCSSGIIPGICSPSCPCKQALGGCHVNGTELGGEATCLIGEAGGQHLGNQNPFRKKLDDRILAGRKRRSLLHFQSTSVAPTWSSSDNYMLGSFS